MGHRLMCGICGIVALGREPELETARAMAQQIAHRGPDGTGEYVDTHGVALAHLRLAILDLSDAGLQPFASDDDRYRLLHNGEIYNYVELRVELEALGHRFRSHTDTEVVLEAYREWGDRCVERFNGMWAIAIWDAAERRLFCSRDRFGVKPFYYRWDGRRLAFASELKAFRADPHTRLEPNLTAVRDYLEQGYVDHTDESFFDGVVSLPPAHSLSLEAGGLRIRRHWSLEPHDRPADAAEAFREVFVDAVRLRLRSDVAIGTALSGGLDSSAVACVVGALRETSEQVGPRPRTFTVYFDDPALDERRWARDVVERVGADPHWITFDDGDVRSVLDAVVETQDEPFGSTSIVAQWFVMREARAAGVKVMLDGQGGDEVLAGYPVTFGYRHADLLAAGRVRALAAELAAYRRIQGAGLAAAAVGLATPFLPAEFRWRLRARRDGADRLTGRALGPRRREAAHRSPFSERLRNQYHLILTRRGLPELLRYEDRNSMAHSLEARVPFLDYRLVELAYSLDASDLVAGAVTKRVLRRALADVLPPSVRDRTSKLGFATPGAFFMRGAVGELAGEVFASRRFAERGWVDADQARAQLARLRSGAPVAEPPLWRALNLELWARRFLD
ncbi:MAG: asparagine synthase (glutamine-hydrolyzing) [Actinomycetota bacterium]